MVRSVLFCYVYHIRLNTLGEIGLNVGKTKVFKHIIQVLQRVNSAFYYIIIVNGYFSFIFLLNL